MGDTIEQWAIYFNPTDAPGKYVVRRWVIGRGTLTPDANAQYADRLEDARGHVPSGRVCLPRLPDDERQIVEVWI